MRGIFENKQLLMQSFEAAGVRPEEVDIVINTHLHFDHCGWKHNPQAGRDDRAYVSPTPATLCTGEKWNTATCSWSATR